MEKSFYIVFQDGLGLDLSSTLRDRGLNNFVILNERLAVLYTPLDFNHALCLIKNEEKNYSSFIEKLPA